MNSKSFSFLLVVGGVLAAVSKSGGSIGLSVLICIVGGFMVTFGLALFTSVYGGTVWGIRVPSSSGAALKKLVGALGVVAGGYAAVHLVLLLISCLAGTSFISFLICLVLYVVLLVVGALVSKSYLEKSTAKGDNAAVLAQLPIFQDVDANIANATFFVVGFEGVALFSSTNYCYAVYRYNDYQLGDLSTPQEVALVGTYFCQKYHQDFTFKVDEEVIPGTPGQTVVAVGTGGIGVARVQGVPDQRLFRSYIFSRKK